MIAARSARGAGRVIVADQAGVEWVRLSAAGRFSSTRERWQSNGLAALEAVSELCFFDDQGFDTGYIKATLPAGHHWPRGMWIAKIVQEVDHIIYMPRIGQHTLAGLTLGQKSAIGWLRDDSRHDLHNDARGSAPRDRDARRRSLRVRLKASAAAQLPAAARVASTGARNLTVARQCG